MSRSSEEIRENVELGEGWQPLRATENRSGISAAGGRGQSVRPFPKKPRARWKDWFEALAWLWFYFFLAGGIFAMVLVLHYICDVLPKR